MRMTKLYMPTLRDVPSEAEVPSHQLLLRAGMIRMSASGVYSFLPLGYRAFKKIENIVKEEMDGAGAQEVHMSAIQPRELWEESGRWSQFGPEMFRLKDRNNREYCLGPTHEEIFTDLVKNELNSYKQLPINLYQIQTKYRDEKRPRYGLIRSKEFVMKDAYSFDRDEAGMLKSYQEMWDAYERIFERCGLNFKVVEGDAGAMGDSDSHEFVALSEYGESTIAYCSGCNYAATDEKAETVYDVKFEESILDMEKVHTPDVRSIEELTGFLGIEANRLAKTLLYRAGEEIVAVMIPGDRELNEVKLVKLLGVAEHELVMADRADVEEVTTAAVGFAGPIGLKEGIRLIVDARVTKIQNMVVGANETDYHMMNVNYGRDFEGEVVEDLLLVKLGDKCPKCGQPLAMDKGTEVGNIFQLQTKYSKALDATFLDENGKEQHFVMGCYGIGISRTLQAVVEQYHDENGIIWPEAVAPFKVVVTIVNVKNEDQVKIGEEIYESLRQKGVEVLLDDRKDRPGVKFKDAELIGIPLRVTVGKRAPEGIVELFDRHTGEKIELEVKEAIRRF
ncbi:proline--tRNA ligase [Vallitalea okinawensis]|uniref:proline--tRNA ligase n=1 Tax=Vallitalea okinawensis TaxID=2078660 RepID=UPI000CFABF27|nr:proline--tRNA ligase [Vallitalea okinawensis]